MPVIYLDIAPMNVESKEKLANELTQTLAKYTNLPPETIYVFFREYTPENIGVGGRLLSEK